MKKVIVMIIVIIGLAVIISGPWLLRAWVNWRVQSHIYTLHQSIPRNGVAIVLGAGLFRNGTPTPVLYDRVATAVELYKSGAVNKLLMSGDSRFAWHNEPEAMRQLALRLGVPDEDIVLDHAGRRTYDTCYRAREIFEVERAIIVTQRFHLNRALYLCDALGIEAVGVVADRRAYRATQQQWWSLREVAALTYAWFDIHVFRPEPVLGEKFPIETAGR